MRELLRRPTIRFGLRPRGVALVLIALIPAAAIILFSSVDRRQNDADRVLDDQLRLVRAVTTHYERELSNAEGILAPLGVLLGLGDGQMAGVRGPGCPAFLNSILVGDPSYYNLLIADAEGTVLCAARPWRASDLRENGFFETAMTQNTLAVSGFRSDETDRWIELAIPVLGADDKAFAAVVVAVDLAAFDKLAADLDLPEYATIEVTDPDGRMLSRLPEADLWAGSIVEEAAFKEGSPIDDESAGKESAAGESRLFAWSTLSSPAGEPVGRVKVSVPTSIAYGPANTALQRDLGILAATTLVVLIAAWWLSGQFLLGPMRRLRRAAAAITAGDLTVSVGPDYPNSEVGSVGRAFDVMAEQLAERRAQLEDANRDLERKVADRTVELTATNERLNEANTTLQDAIEEASRLEADLRRRTADLENANHELESFAYSVSHDLRAPLRAIDGFSRTLVRDYHEQLDEKGKDRLERVRAAAQRMGELIDELLRLSRTSRAEMTPQPVDLAELARANVAQLTDGDPGRNFEFQAPESIPVVADRVLIGALVQNLIENAWKFTAHHESANVELGILNIEGETVYFVRDDGAGFDMQYAAKLFRPFQRLHSDAEFRGYGIGLATSQRIVRRHGGRIWADGAVEQGATFYFTLGTSEATEHLEEKAA